MRLLATVVVHHAAAIQSIIVKNWPTSDTTTKDLVTASQHLNVISIVGICVSTIVGFFIVAAFWMQREANKIGRESLLKQEHDGQLALAMTLVADFDKKILDNDAPSESLQSIDFETQTAYIAAMTRTDLTKELFAQTPLALEYERHCEKYRVLSEYFETAWYLFDESRIDRRYFLDRMGTPIAMAAAKMKPWQYASFLYPSQLSGIQSLWLEVRKRNQEELDKERQS
jgi:hypothetical protein